LRAEGRDAGFKQVNVTVDFMRGGAPQLSFARGTITRLGRTMANVEAQAWQDDTAKPMAIAHMHYLISDRVKT
jgi:acyl-coenzyme A thioesterase PaaI-like protein